MTGILMTQVSTPIIGQAAWLLGKIMDGIYRVMDLIGIHNLGVCIILLTIVIYTLLMPLTIKQQKFSKMSAAMNPELQKVQQKYKGKNDQASMQKMQEETQLVYEKYGVSPTGGCLSMFIQFPILWAMYYVIRNIPAYVGQVKAVYTPLLTSIMAQDGWQKVMEKIGEAKPILMSASKYDYSDKNVLIDVLYKFQTSTWETLGKKLPDLQSTIDSTVDTLKSMNNFLGLNIAETPMNLISNGVKAGAWGIVIMAVLIPVLSGLSQYLSVKLSQQTTAVTNNPQADQMASTMKTMNVTLPLVSVFMCFTLPTGLGIYWVASAVVRMVQQFFINKHLKKIPMDELIKENIYQMMVAATKNQEPMILKDLNHTTCTRWHPDAMDIIPATGGKGIGTKKILEYFGFSADEAMAFGDGGNDKDMLETVGCGIAMGNAVESVKQVANYVTKPVSEDGVYWALKHFNLI